jgi:putative pyruvate formate lyase activating enzyme
MVHHGDRFQIGYDPCMLCPRRCGSFRSGFSAGGRAPYCGESSTLRLAYVGPHFGEEPPITGTRGSGTVFFSGCSLKCSYCQNHQITHQAMGKAATLEELFDLVTAMINDSGVHNINMVTPDHFFPHVFHLVERLKKEGYDLPIVYNLSGYQSVEMVREAESRADIYLPDYKYSDGKLAAALSGCGNYPRIALEAIDEMVRQKGFLNRWGGASSPASRGVLVRHLILPGHIENSLAAVTSLFVEFGRELPVSLMSQYRPVVPQKYEELNRVITMEEFNVVYQYVQELGFENLFVQFPEGNGCGGALNGPFVPDFAREKVFER